MKYLRMYCLSSCIVETHSEADIFKSGLGLLFFFLQNQLPDTTGLKLRKMHCGDNSKPIFSKERLPVN